MFNVTITITKDANGKLQVMKSGIDIENIVEVLGVLEIFKQNYIEGFLSHGIINIK